MFTKIYEGVVKWSFNQLLFLKIIVWIAIGMYFFLNSVKVIDKKNNIMIDSKFFLLNCIKKITVDQQILCKFN